MQEIMVKKFKIETITKVLERLIKNEKFFCKILISIILLMIKQNSKDQKGTESSFKDQALGLIKKILKKKVWEHISNAPSKSSGSFSIPVEDWICIKRGLMIYFGNKLNWSKESYRIWKEYITDNRLREEMIKESPEV